MVPLCCAASRWLTMVAVVMLGLSVVLVPASQVLADNGKAMPLNPCPGDTACNTSCTTNACCILANGGTCGTTSQCSCYCNKTVNCTRLCMCGTRPADRLTACHCNDQMQSKSQ
jgi:hypothetical protein